jgi:hypothetical protein
VEGVPQHPYFLLDEVRFNQEVAVPEAEPQTMSPAEGVAQIKGVFHHTFNPR